MPDFTTCPKCCDQRPQRCFPTAKYKNQAPNPRTDKLPTPKAQRRVDKCYYEYISKTKSRNSPIDFLTSQGFKIKKPRNRTLTVSTDVDFETEDVPGLKTKGVQFLIKMTENTGKGPIWSPLTPTALDTGHYWTQAKDNLRLEPLMRISTANMAR